MVLTYRYHRIRANALSDLRTYIMNFNKCEHLIKWFKKIDKLNWKEKSYKMTTRDKELFKNLKSRVRKETPYYMEYEKEYNRIKERRKKGIQRYKKYATKMFEYYFELYWCTFTISEEWIGKKTKEEFKKELQKWLKKNAKDYIANIDFGEKNERLHFHAIVASKENYFTWKYGHLFVKEINIRKGTEAIARYANRFANHATKSTAQKVFHPRGFVEIERI